MTLSQNEKCIFCGKITYYLEADVCYKCTLLQSQNGKCPICEGPLYSAFNKENVVMAPRGGLFCPDCNEDINEKPSSKKSLEKPIKKVYSGTCIGRDSSSGDLCSRPKDPGSRYCKKCRKDRESLNSSLRQQTSHRINRPNV